MSNYKPFWEEEILIGTAVVKLTSSYYDTATRADLYLRNSSANYAFLETPTTNVGYGLAVNEVKTFYGYNELSRIKFVGATTTTGSTGSRLFVTYFE